jgi:cytochrome c biogenesis factor
LIKKQIYTSNYGNFIFKWNDSTWSLFPEQSFSFFSNALITKSSILTNGLTDCYITILEDSYSGLVHLTFNYMTTFIWGGGFIIILAVFFTLIKDYKKSQIKVWF